MHMKSLDVVLILLVISQMVHFILVFFGPHNSMITSVKFCLDAVTFVIAIAILILIKKNRSNRSPS